jgi:hypothetical protein
MDLFFQRNRKSVREATGKTGSSVIDYFFDRDSLQPEAIQYLSYADRRPAGILLNRFRYTKIPDHICSVSIVLHISFAPSLHVPLSAHSAAGLV